MRHLNLSVGQRTRHLNTRTKTGITGQLDPRKHVADFGNTADDPAAIDQVPDRCALIPIGRCPPHRNYPLPLPHPPGLPTFRDQESLASRIGIKRDYRSNDDSPEAVRHLAGQTAQLFDELPGLLKPQSLVDNLPA